MPNKRSRSNNLSNYRPHRGKGNKKPKLNPKFSFSNPLILSSNINLDVKLFSMINNDASLVNSSLQGGSISDAAGVLNAFVDNFVIRSPDQDFENFKTILSQITGNNDKIQKVIFEGAKVDTPGLRRLNLIESLAKEFKSSISSLRDGESFFIPGGFFRHAMLYEFKREADKINLIVYNTGNGVGAYHENKLTFENGVFKTKFFPACAYEFHQAQADSLEFSNYLTELLKVSIASEWETNNFDNNQSLIVKHYDKKDLYDNTLPLIAHIDGKRVDPKKLVKNNSFITGQRSGKCSEAVFHPIIRSTLKNEKNYQRFMCAYRQATIATFIERQKSLNNLSNPINKRQIKNALSNLASRVYKHKDYFSSEEISQINSFISAQQKNLDSTHMNVDEEQTSLSLKSDEFTSIQRLPIVNTDTTSEIKQLYSNPIYSYPSNQLLQDELRELIECKDTDEPLELIDKLTTGLSWAEAAVTDVNIPPRMIIEQIEKILLTWPIDKKEFVIIDGNIKDLINKIKKLINIYCEQTLIQFGINTPNSLKALFPNQVATILSGLAIIAQVVINSGDKVDAVFVQKLMKLTGIVDLSNTYNPYLASGNLRNDLTFNKLSQFFNKFLDIKSDKIKPLYEDIINSYPEQKNKLINYYYQLINENKRKFIQYCSLNEEKLAFLTDVDKCILILKYYRSDVLKSFEKDQTNNIQELIKKLDFLVSIEQVTAVLGKMLSNTVSGDPENKLLNNDAKYDELLNINSSKDMSTGDYKFELQSPSAEGISIFYFKRRYRGSCVKSSKQKINDEYLDSFLVYDIDQDFSVHSQQIKEYKFLSSNIQIEKPERLTEELVYFKQFCHTRSSSNCQLLLTINFFKEHMNLLSQDKWKIVCELNLLQPRILLTALEYNPDTINILFAFLERGLIENITEIASNETALFFIKMQIIFNNYLKEYDGYKDIAIKNLNKLNNQIIHILQDLKDEATKAKLYNYQALLLSCLIPLETTENPQLIKIYIEAKLQSNNKLNSMIQLDPEEFIRQEQMCLNMKKYILQYSEEIKNYCIV
jgi:hypothetical protein